MMPLRNFTLHIFLFMAIAVHAAVPQVQFTDVTAEAGIQFRHVNGAEGDYHLPETIGSGGAFFDYNNDGNLDLYLVNSGNWRHTASSELATSVLYRNNGDGTFADVTAIAGVDNAGNYGQGVAVGDYNNDGNADLYVTNFGANVLYRNNGDGTFTDVTETAGVGGALWSSSTTFFDYNRDGYLDLFVVNYVDYSIDIPYRPCGVGQTRTYCHPSLFEGVPDQLYRNNGDGTFTDVTATVGVGGIGGPFRGKGLGVVAADFNNDGHPDLYVANDDTPNNLFYNNGDGTFTDIALIAGCAYSFDGVAQAGMGVDAGDYNGDGLLDLFVCNLSHETNALYRNNGDGTFSDVIYETHLGKESYLYVGFGTGFFDYDNDGHLDLFIANGHVIDNVELTSDVLTYAQRNQMFHNNRDGTFTEVAFDPRERVSRGAIFGDYDNDGDVDLVVTHSNQPAELYRNDGGNQQNWLRIKTVGIVSNRDGIGTKVTLTTGKQSQFQEVHTSASYLSSNDSRLLFGLGKYTTVDRLEIRWPSGAMQVLENLPVNQELVIEEEKGSADFFKAVRENDIEAVRVALRNGADIDATNALGNTGLMIVAIQGRVAVGELFVEQSADVNAKNMKGNSALIFSVHAAGNVDFARMLIENGADLNASNSDNETALMYAASKGHADILRLLIENGADIHVKNSNGLNALMLAESKGDDAIVDMLKSAGAK